LYKKIKTAAFHSSLELST